MEVVGSSASGIFEIYVHVYFHIFDFFSRTKLYTQPRLALEEGSPKSFTSNKRL